MLFLLNIFYFTIYLDVIIMLIILLLFFNFIKHNENLVNTNCDNYTLFFTFHFSFLIFIFLIKYDNYQLYTKISSSINHTNYILNNNYIIIDNTPTYIINYLNLLTINLQNFFYKVYENNFFFIKPIYINNIVLNYFSYIYYNIDNPLIYILYNIHIIIILILFLFIY